MLKRTRSEFWLSGVLAAVLVLAGCSGSISAENKEAEKEKSAGVFSRIFGTATPIAVPEGTVISVTLDHALASNQHESGDEFDATVSSAVIVNGKTVIPHGARARGIVVEAQESGRLKGVARLRLALAAVEADGKWYDVQTSSVTRSGGDHKKRNWALIGGGTGLGAAIGGIAGGGKGAAIGAAAGAGAGTATAAATGKKDITLPAETPLSFKLTNSMTISVKG